MRISVNWLNEWLGTPAEARDLATRLTMAGLEVEGGREPSARAWPRPGLHHQRRGRLGDERPRGTEHGGGGRLCGERPDHVVGLDACDAQQWPAKRMDAGM